MKIYQFYSDFYDQHNRSIPSEIRDDANYNDKPIPEKYRSRNLDLFITEIDDLLPPDLKHYTAAQIWWSENRNDWRVELWFSSNMEKIKLVKEKYHDSIKELNQFPDYTPIHLFAFLVECQFAEYWEEYRELMEKYGVRTTQKPIRWEE